ncbi:MAG: ribonuclease VapC33 [Myxococcaceae bacterium]
MIIPDVNLLLYVNIDATPQHAKARPWFERLLNDDEPVGFAPAAVLGFVRLATSRRVYAEPLTVEDAVGRVRAWLARPQAVLLEQTREVVSQTLELLIEAGAAGNLTTDAQLAAHALVQRATIASADGDFARFPRVKWVNPLRPSR